MRKVALLILKYSIFFSLPSGETWSIDGNVGSVKEQPIEEVNLHLSPYSGRIRQPWIFIPGLPDRLPICYNGSSEHLENIVRLSQVLCRHSGYMIATKWIPILGDTGGIFRRGLVANAYCRGDEQLIEHCQWHQPIYNMCNEFLALECDDCSRTYHLKEDSEITLTSPGFPFYIPLVTCEWNVTLMPEHNLVIRFQQFDLPSPDYDETIDGISCRSGSLDILPYRADINRITLDGRFCGHHSPGNVTIFSNRVLIRFIAGNYKLDVISKKGFAAEFLIVPASSITNSTIITRWVLIGCAVFLSAVFIISFWFCKKKLTQFRQFCCCRVNPVNVSNSDIGQQMAFSSTNNCSPIRMSRAQQPSHFTSYNNRRDTKGCAIEASDFLHRQQTQQLEKWQSTRTGTSGGTVVKAVEIPEFALKDDSHIYEDIEVASDEGNENSVYLNLSD